jgi:hypothetical protein
MFALKCNFGKTGCLCRLSNQGRIMPPAGTNTPNNQPSIGFLTVLDHGEEGLYGGYLTLNLSGRPLEFHCTAPIKPNRAQEILYGPTLEPYLYGEQIGQTLLSKAGSQPLLVCTDHPAALAVRDYIDIPVTLVLPPQENTVADSDDPKTSSSQKTWRIDSAHGSNLTEFHLGRNHLAVPSKSIDDRQAIVKCLDDLSESFDMAEPFVRIREAIEEARRGGR